MSLAIPSVDDFKAQFARDFPYAVPAWGAKATLTLAAGAIASVTVNAGGFGYASKPTATISDPTRTSGAAAVLDVTVAAGKVTAVGVTSGGSGYVAPTLSFSGGAGNENDLKMVRDVDVAAAIVDAKGNTNPDLFLDQETYSRAFLFLAAHCLVRVFRAAGQGLRSQYSWALQGKSAGALSESYAIPTEIRENPFLASLGTTEYGARYLEIVLPLIRGNVAAFYRQSLP